MKTPIDPKDIRKGDLIRLEGRTEGRDSTAHEFRAVVNGDRDGWVRDRFNWYLLDRPQPPVELPTEPTLGWLTLRIGGFFSGPTGRRVLETVWLDNAGTGLIRAGRTDVLAVDRVESFTPATAVPTSALDDLKSTESRVYTGSYDVAERNEARREAIQAFLAAIDEANS